MGKLKKQNCSEVWVLKIDKVGLLEYLFLLNIFNVWHSPIFLKTRSYLEWKK